MHTVVSLSATLMQHRPIFRAGLTPAIVPRNEPQGSTVGRKYWMVVSRDYRHSYQRVVAVHRLSRQGAGATGEALWGEAGGYSGATSAIRRSGEGREEKEIYDNARTSIGC